MSDLETEKDEFRCKLTAAFEALEDMVLPEDPIHEVCDNGTGSDGQTLVVNVRLVGGRMAHFCFKEGEPISLKIFER